MSDSPEITVLGDTSTNFLTDERWRHIRLPANATLQQAIRNLDQYSIKIVLVVNEAGELLGTISDGDIRRGLLKGLDLNSSITSVVQRKPLVVPPQMGRDMVLQLMAANKIQQIPVIDGQGQVVGLHLWEQIMTRPERSNLMVIMAGGRGSRLKPFTDNCPKPLVRVGGKPILEHIIERAKLEGFSHFVLAIHYLGEMIKDHFGNGERLGIRIEYLQEKKPLGTAGALSLLEPRPVNPFVVTNGDVITDIHYGELLDFHIRSEATATMAVRIHEWQHPFGVVQTNGIEIVGFDEKPCVRTHINAGVYALSSEALTEIDDLNACDMPILFERLQAKAKRTVAYPMHEPWLDVGRPDDLVEAIKIHENGGVNGRFNG